MKFAKSIQIVPKWIEHFAQNQLNLKYFSNDFWIFPKAVEFRQIWSHWTQLNAPSLSF